MQANMLTGPQNLAATGALTEKLQEVRGRIAAAAVRHGRQPQDIALLAIGKGQPAAAIRALAAAGQRDFGENYLQEAQAKIEALRDCMPTWHYVGQIQSNKTRTIAEHFAWVHTVDRIKIAQRLSAQRPGALPPLNVCIQIKLADEPGKGGVAPSAVATLAAEVAALPRITLRGLMCIPPPRQHYAEQLADFASCAALLRSLPAGLALDTLSMGMSADLEAAVAAGATLVRIGTALFGARP
jgi:PLP dependent protein